MKFGKRGVFTVRCIVPGSRATFTVSLYDKDKALVGVCETDKDSFARFTVPRTGEYSVCAEAECETSPRRICSWIYLCRDKSSSKAFLFEKLGSSPLVKTTFRLEDANYSGLPISQGVIDLWHR